MIEKLRIDAASVISRRVDALLLRAVGGDRAALCRLTASSRTPAMVLEISEGVLEPTLQPFLGTPSERRLRACRRYHGAALLAWALTRVFGGSRKIRDRGERRIKIVHVGFDAGADIQR